MTWQATDFPRARILRRRSTARGTAAIIVVIAASALTGILTAFGQQVLPHAIRSMANSSAPWALVALAAIYVVGLRGRRAVVTGAAAFLVMDLSFFVVFDSFGFYYPHSYLAFWMTIGVLVGPLIGLCASWLRDARPRRRAIGAAAPSAILIGESLFMLVRLPGDSTLYAIACLAAGVGCAVVLPRLLVRRPAHRLVSAALTLGGAAAFFALYGLIPLLLDKVVP